MTDASSFSRQRRKIGERRKLSSLTFSQICHFPYFTNFLVEFLRENDRITKEINSRGKIAAIHSWRLHRSFQACIFAQGARISKFFDDATINHRLGERYPVKNGCRTHGGRDDQRNTENIFWKRAYSREGNDASMQFLA